MPPGDKDGEAREDTPAKPDHPADQPAEQAIPDNRQKPDEPAAEEAESPPDIIHEVPAEFDKCLSDLTILGAKYEKARPVDEGHGCGIEQPLKVSDILPGVSVGGAVMRCETARNLAHWLKDTVQPALAASETGGKLVVIKPGTTYACRLRNNAATGPISEHARGNAFDVAAFGFDNGKTIEMKPRQDDHTIEGAFQKAVTGGACLYFTTVLAPGSDASHETHLHVDNKDRKNGYRICESP